MSKLMESPKDDKFYADEAKANGIDSNHQCCSKMAYYISKPTLWASQGRNRVLDWIAQWNEYHIPVSYDGNSSTIIDYCPWCSSKLTESKRRLWYETLYSLGFDDPGQQDIPDEFNSDKWWRQKKEQMIDE